MERGKDPARVEREEREELARAIERRVRDIAEQWLARVQDWVAGRDVSPTQLRGYIEEYLRALVGALRAVDPVEASGAAAWQKLARDHALTRVRLGFDVEQLVREFILLRRVLFNVCQEEGLLSTERHGARLAELLEEAIAAAVRTYVESRDYAARREEAQHIAFLSHEIKNPLTAATLAAASLRARGKLDEEGLRALERLQSALDRMRHLIDKVLVVERFAAEKVEAHLRDVPLSAILEPALEAARAMAAAKRLRLELRGPTAALVRADPDLAISAVQNLADNAVKYADQGLVRVDVEETPAEVTVHFRDDCGGLSEEELRTLFEPFRRGRRQKGGSGLGLAIARRAARAQGGDVGGESREERGCHFWFTLRRAAS